MKIVARAAGIIACLLLYVLSLALFVALFALPWDVIGWP